MTPEMYAKALAEKIPAYNEMWPDAIKLNWWNAVDRVLNMCERTPPGNGLNIVGVWSYTNPLPSPPDGSKNVTYSPNSGKDE